MAFHPHLGSAAASLSAPSTPTIALGTTFTIGATIVITPGAGGGPVLHFAELLDGVASGRTVAATGGAVNYVCIAEDCVNALTFVAVGPSGLTSSPSNALGQTAPSACGDTNFLGGAAGTAAMDLGDDRTLIVVLDPSDAAPQTPATGFTILSATAGLGTKGWALFARTNGDAPRLTMFYNKAGGAGYTEVVNFGSLSRTPGKPLRIVVVDDGSTLRCSVNGSPVVAVAHANGIYAAVDGACTMALGKFVGLATFGDDHNRVASFAILSRAVSDGEAVAESGLTSSWAIALSQDAACTIDAHASRDYTGGATWVTLGSAPITLTKSGTVTSALISAAAFVPVMLTRPDDTGLWTPVTAGGASYHRVTQQARWVIDTDAEEIVVQRILTEGSPYFGDCAVRIVGGATPAPIIYQGAFGYPYPLSARFSLGTGGTAKVLELVAGVQSNIGSPAVFLGDFPYRIDVPHGRTATVRAATTPTRRLVIYGDSMVAERTTNPELLGFAGLMRLDYPGQITVDAALNRSLYDDTVGGGIGQAALVALLSAECDGTVTNELLVNMGLEDHWRELWVSRAAFTTAFNAFLVAFRAARPDVTMWVITRTPADAPYGDTAIATVAQWQTAQSDACVGVANCTVIDGSSLCAFDSTNYDAADVATTPNRVHFTTTGAAAAKATLKTALGY